MRTIITMTSFGLLAGLLAACAPSDTLAEKASDQYCKYQQQCESGRLWNPDVDNSLQKCKDDYIAQLGNMIDGCDVDWELFHTSKKLLQDQDACADGVSGLPLFDERFNPVEMPQYCTNFDGTGKIIPSEAKSKYTSK